MSSISDGLAIVYILSDTWWV